MMALVDRLSPLSNDLRGIINNLNSFSDLTFLVEGKKILVHKVIISNRCEYFREMLKKDRSVAEITVDDYKYSAFYSVVEFLVSTFKSIFRVNSKFNQQ